ncbi:hemerythrin domain-containing protein [Noviherbaspirillum sp. Root189]|uniref:hemerythrin domain-containing protein n=1 Tax=Noviherbaspirillum sp. Root189 TaxID=1736487 RepID=UPI00138F4937|nr:hemerythrin domain-containing protein [Noviherbaspirillum sp. Root189]
MQTISAKLIEDHKHWDQLFLEVEKHVLQCRWKEAVDNIAEFKTVFERHIATEEAMFFPLIKLAGGEDAWPLMDLRSEHAKLEMILARIAEAIQKQSKADFYLHAESFFILMHTHSIKEDQILYPKLERYHEILPRSAVTGK